MAEAIAKSLDNANSAQVGYFIGYLTFNILEFFVPITKVAKVRSVNDLFKAAAPLKASVAKASGIATDAGSSFLKALEDFIVFLRRGGEGLKQLIDNIFEAIRKWLGNLAGVVKAELLLYSFRTRGGRVAFSLEPVSAIILTSLKAISDVLGTVLAKLFVKRTEKVVGIKIAKLNDKFVVAYEGTIVKTFDSKKKLAEYIQGIFKKYKKDDELKKYFKNILIARQRAITLYRIQGGIPPNASKVRFVVKNNKVIIEGEERLYVTFRDQDRVLDFLIQRGGKAEIFTAEVSEAFFKKIFDDVVPQSLGKKFPDKPQYGDRSKTDFSVGIPNNYFDELLENIKNIEIIKFD